MKIVFNGLNSGLGNNGGSRTILKSVEALRNLGHTCEVIACTDNFTWFAHKPVLKYVPIDFDVVINIAAVDYDSTKNCSIDNKFAWWRGHENWANTSDHLKYCYRDKSIYNLVNSKGLQLELNKYNAQSQVVYQGLDFYLWQDKKLRVPTKLTIGCLYNNKKSKKWCDFKHLFKILGTKDYIYVAFGTPLVSDSFLDEYVSNPSQKELVSLYSSCDIWFAPTEEEGLHNPPMEAALCGSLVVCSDSKNNGMASDYADNNTTAVIYPQGDIEKAAKFISNLDTVNNYKMIKNMQDKLHTVIGTREDNMNKLLSIMENKYELK